MVPLSASPHGWAHLRQIMAKIIQRSILRLTGKILLGILLFTLAAMLLIPGVFHGLISSTLRDYARQYLTSELHFKDSRLSFFRHFPALTLSLDSVSLAGSPPFPDSELLRAREVSLSLNPWPLLFSKRVEIDGIYLASGDVRILVDATGNPNYNVYRDTDTTATESSSETLVDIDHIRITDTRLTYSDILRGLQFRTRGLNYRGSGSFHGDRIQIGSALDVDSADVEIEGIPYLEGKSLNAQVALAYDSQTLLLDFGRNSLSINDLDLEFQGQVRANPDATEYDLQVELHDGKLSDVISALPPEYVAWNKQLTTSGRVDASVHLVRSLLTGADTARVEDQVDFTVNLHDGRIQHRSVPLPVEHMRLVAAGSVAPQGLRLDLDTLNFDIGGEFSRANLHLAGRQDSLEIQALLNANLNLGTLSESLKLPNLAFRGRFRGDLVSGGTYQPKADRFPRSQGALTLSDGYVKTSFPEPFKDIQLDMRLQNGDGTLSGTSLDFGRLSFNFVDNPFEMTASFDNFKTPRIDLKAKGSMDLTSLSEIYPFPGFSADGFVRLDASIKGGLVRAKAEGETDHWEFQEQSGTLFLEGNTINSKYLPRPLKIISGDFTFQLGRLDFRNFLLLYDTNYSEINGYFKNYLPYLLLPDGILAGEFTFASKRIDVDKLLPTHAPAPPGSPDTLAVAVADTANVREQVAGVIQVPPRINFQLTMAVDTLRYFDLEVHEVSGELTIAEAGLLLKKGGFQLVGGQAALEGYYNPVRADEALFSFRIRAENLDIQRAYNEIELFRNLVPAAEKAHGLVGFDYELSGVLDGKMYPVLPSLEGSGTVNARDIAFKGYRLFGTVSRQTSIGALNDPKLKEIAFKSTIDSNLIDIERFKFKVPPFRLRMEGQTSLDGKLNLQMRVGLPPFGIIGIPVRITGEGGEMDVKLGRRTRELEGLDFEEDEMTEEERLRFGMLRDSITDEMDVDAIQALEQRLDTLSLEALKNPADSLPPQNGPSPNLRELPLRDSLPPSPAGQDSIYPGRGIKRSYIP